MNKEQIIQMAQEAGFCHDINNGIYLCAPMHIERFAALVAQRVLAGSYPEMIALVAAAEREQGQKWFDAVTAQHKQEILAEREACAKFADQYMRDCEGKSFGVGNAIRARGKTK